MGIRDRHEVAELRPYQIQGHTDHIFVVRHVEFIPITLDPKADSSIPSWLPPDNHPPLHLGINCFILGLQLRYLSLCSWLISFNSVL